MKEIIMLSQILDFLFFTIKSKELMSIVNLMNTIEKNEELLTNKNLIQFSKKYSIDLKDIFDFIKQCQISEDNKIVSIINNN